MMLLLMRKNRTGETRVFEDKYAVTWAEGEFKWTEGNFSCDCNRHLYWLRAKGPPKIGNQFWNNAHTPECADWRYTLLAVDEGTGMQPIQDRAIR